MSIARQFRRSAARKLGKEWEGAPQPYRSLPDGGYRVLHPTKGWKRVCGKRARLYA